MKIAMIGTTLFHQGAEYVLAAIARGMAAHGHDVTVILSKYHEDWQTAHPDWKPFELGDKVKVVIQTTRRARESVFTLRKIIVQGGYDVVLCNSGSYTYSLAVMSYLIRKPPVLIHVEHSSGFGTDGFGNRIEPKFSFRGCLRNVLFRRMDAQFTVSDGTADAITRMTGYPRKRIYTVYNPVVDEVFACKLAAKPAHPWLKERDVPVVAAAGAFCSFKNHPLLLRAWAEVVKKYKARLIIFGEGGMRGEYEALIAKLGIGDSVSLPGFTDNLPAALKRAACFVVSSTIESFSVVLVEALAAGTPVVSTNCPYGPPEILHGGKYGILVKNNDIYDLAAGILKVLGGNGIKPPPEAWKPFTVESIVARYEACLGDVIRNVNENIQDKK